MKIIYKKLSLMLTEREMSNQDLKENLQIASGTMTKLNKGQEVSMGSHGMKMIRFAYLGRTKEQISCYFSLEDNCIYKFDDSEEARRGAEAGRMGGKIGGIVGIFIYPFMGKLCWDLTANYVIVGILVLSIITACACHLYIIFVTSRKIERAIPERLHGDEISELMKECRSYWRKCRWLEIAMLFFGAIATILSAATGNGIIFASAALLIAVFLLLVIMRRPICSIRFRKFLMRGGEHSMPKKGKMFNDSRVNTGTIRTRLIRLLEE